MPRQSALEVGKSRGIKPLPPFDHDQRTTGFAVAYGRHTDAGGGTVWPGCNWQELQPAAPELTSRHMVSAVA